MSHRILIVEDEQIVAADLEMKLRALGHQVIGVVSSGREAIEAAEKTRPNVVLMDIRLRGEMPGTEAASRIQKATGATVIFVTAYTRGFVKELSEMQPPGVCISKPFSILELTTALGHVLEVNASPSSNQP